MKIIPLQTHVISPGYGFFSLNMESSCEPNYIPIALLSPVKTAWSCCSNGSLLKFSDILVSTNAKASGW